MAARPQRTENEKQSRVKACAFLLKTDSNFSVCARRCDSQRLVFHGHFVCLCAVMSACISEAAPSQSQMKLISIKPFQIRRADGKRTAFKKDHAVFPISQTNMSTYHRFHRYTCVSALRVTIPLTLNCSYLPSG